MTDRSAVPWTLLVPDADRTLAQTVMGAGHLWIGGQEPAWWSSRDTQIHRTVVTKLDKLLKLMGMRLPEEEILQMGALRNIRAGPNQ